MTPTKKMKKKKKVAPEMTTRRQRRLTLRRLIDANEEIWVTNQSGKITGKEAGNVVFQVGVPPAIDVVLIPPGNDPVCITDQVDPESLKSCIDLFKLINAGALELLDPEKAEEYYAENQGRQKIVEEKINALISHKRPDVAPPPVSSMNVQVHAKVGDVCMKAKHGAISQREALERLMEQQSVLKMDDYNYLIANGVYDPVKHWAQQQKDNLLDQAVAEDPVEVAMRQ